MQERNPIHCVIQCSRRAASLTGSSEDSGAAMSRSETRIDGWANRRWPAQNGHFRTVRSCLRVLAPFRRGPERHLYTDFAKP